MQEKGEKVAAWLPQGKLVIIKGGIHATNYDSPAALHQAIGPFLASACLPLPSTKPVAEGGTNQTSY